MPSCGGGNGLASAAGRRKANERNRGGQQRSVRVDRDARREIGQRFTVWPGGSFVGRADERAADVDVSDQEAEDRRLSSRQHALIVSDGSALTVQDLNTRNGTYVNREKLKPGQHLSLVVGDVLQVGGVQLKVGRPAPPETVHE